MLPYGCALVSQSAQHLSGLQCFVGKVFCPPIQIAFHVHLALFLEFGRPPGCSLGAEEILTCYYDLKVMCNIIY